MGFLFKFIHNHEKAMKYTGHLTHHEKQRTAFLLFYKRLGNHFLSKHITTFMDVGSLQCEYDMIAMKKMLLSIVMENIFSFS